LRVATTGNAEYCGFECAGYSAGVRCIVAEIPAVVDSRHADVRTLIFGKDSVESQCDAVGRCAVDGPMTFVHLPDAQRPSERKAVRSAAHLRRRRDHVHVTHLLQGFFEFDQPIGVDAVVVCDQDSRHTLLTLAHSSFGGPLTQERPVF
jgi:hypothetical protein